MTQPPPGAPPHPTAAPPAQGPLSRGALGSPVPPALETGSAADWGQPGSGGAGRGSGAFVGGSRRPSPRRGQLMGPQGCRLLGPSEVPCPGEGSRRGPGYLFQQWVESGGLAGGRRSPAVAVPGRFQGSAAPWDGVRGGSLRAPEGSVGNGQPGGPVAAPRRGSSPGAAGLRRGVRPARGAPCSGDGMGRGRRGRRGWQGRRSPPRSGGGGPGERPGSGRSGSRDPGEPGEDVEASVPVPSRWS